MTGKGLTKKSISVRKYTDRRSDCWHFYGVHLEDMALLIEPEIFRASGTKKYLPGEIPIFP